MEGAKVGEQLAAKTVQYAPFPPLQSEIRIRLSPIGEICLPCLMGKTKRPKQHMPSKEFSGLGNLAHDVIL
jgi:hypothetical protein